MKDDFKRKTKFNDNYDDLNVRSKGGKRIKRNQFNKCRNNECEDNDYGFCSKYKDRAKSACKHYK